MNIFDFFKQRFDTDDKPEPKKMGKSVLLIALGALQICAGST